MSHIKTRSCGLLNLVPIQRRSIKLKQLQLAHLKEQTFGFELPVSDAENKVQTSPDPDGRMINAIARLEEMSRETDLFVARALSYIDEMRKLVHILDPQTAEILEEKFFDSDYPLPAAKVGNHLNFAKSTIEQYCSTAYHRLDEYLQENPNVLENIQNLM